MRQKSIIFAPINIIKVCIIPIRPNNILQLHRDLYSFSSSDTGGRFKNTDNVIAESSKDGQQRVRFIPVPAFQTPEAMENLCNEFNKAIDRAEYDPLLLIPMFILDFLCIHPFNDWKNRSMLLHHLSWMKCRKSIKPRILLTLIIKLLWLIIVLFASKNRSTLLHSLKNSSIMLLESEHAVTLLGREYSVYC